jgi:predicted glycosyltransferase
MAVLGTLDSGQTMVFRTASRERETSSERIATVQSSKGPKIIWIDLDNSPHVPFFIPIIEELEKRGYSVFLTARDAYQVVELVELHHLNCERIGRHYGKFKIMKVIGVCYRAFQLLRIARKQNLALALSHGSRAQIIAATLLRIPTVLIFDYEYTKRSRAIDPTWTMRPEVIYPDGDPHYSKRGLKYPGLKEDVYVPRLRPDPAIRSRLGVSDQELMVTVRPPASEAHYHNPKSDDLFHAAVNFLGQKPEVRMVLLPRNERQAVSIRNEWPELIDTGKIIIPDHVVDGLNLLWFSDLAISGGGTMNREAAALGIPVYSIFRGSLGAVDRYLSESGRLVMIENVRDLSSKIKLHRWDRPETPAKTQSKTLSVIIENLVSILADAPFQAA